MSYNKFYLIFIFGFHSMASPVNTELKVKGVCYDYLNTAECARMDCKFTHIPPTVPYMDSHCHLDLMMTWKPKLSFSDIPQVPHFKGAISNFCFPKAWRLMDELAHPKVWFTIGVHPKDAPLFDSHQLELASLMKKPKVVAIGECGLDYFHGHTTRLRVLQKEVFDQQATLAHDAGKPLVIHCRDAERDAFEIARKCLSSNHKIHLHCFSSSVDDMWMWMNHFPNLKVGFTNLVTWEKSRVKNAVSAVKSAPFGNRCASLCASKSGCKGCRYGAHGILYWKIFPSWPCTQCCQKDSWLKVS